MKISELKNCPAWLKKATTLRANVSIVNGVVHWHSGTWVDGTWKSGIWKGGEWCYGTWQNGTWINGSWYDGTWEAGNWENGTWHGGNWYGGTWEGGTFKSGSRVITSKYNIYINSNKTITIGCKTKTYGEWNKWFKSKKTYNTPRDTPTFQQIHAHYNAIVAYGKTLGTFR